MAKHSVKCLVNVCDRKLLFDLLYVRYVRLAFTSVVRTDLFFSMKGVQGIKETVQTTSLYNVRNKSKKNVRKKRVRNLSKLKRLISLSFTSVQYHRNRTTRWNYRKKHFHFEPFIIQIFSYNWITIQLELNCNVKTAF